MSSPSLASLLQLVDCGLVPLAQNTDAEIFFVAVRFRLPLRVTNSDGNLAFECDLPDSSEKFAFTDLEKLVAKVRFRLNELRLL